MKEVSVDEWLRNPRYPFTKSSIVDIVLNFLGKDEPS